MGLEENLETKLCKHCQSEIPKRAKVCPNCRRKQGGKGKIIIAVIVVLLLLFIIGSSGDSDESSTASSADSTGTEQNSSETSEDVEDNNSSAENTDTLTKDEFIETCESLANNYKDIARNPDDYVGQNFYFLCYISSARNSDSGKYYVTYAWDRDKADEYLEDGIADSLEDVAFYAVDYDKEVWITDSRNESADDYVKLLEDDVVMIYGTFYGLMGTQNSLTGETGEIVSLNIKYAELIEE